MRPRVLVVDDETLLAQSIAEYFEHHGYAADLANEREEAEAMIATGAYEAVITDVRLTQTERDEGLDVVSFVRRCSPDAVVVVLTAFPTSRTEQAAHARGACLLLAKPQPLAEVESRVRALLGSCGMRGHSGACAAWCDAASDRIDVSADLRVLARLLAAVLPDREDGANSALLVDIGLIVDRLGAAASPSLRSMLAYCLRDSPILAGLLRSTAGDERTAGAARKLAIALDRLGDA